jgi:prolyl oligopeptidase
MDIYGCPQAHRPASVFVPPGASGTPPPAVNAEAVPAPPYRDDDCVDVLHGQVIRDPYRGMERNDAVVQAWAGAESARTDAVLQSLPGYGPLAADVSAMSQWKAANPPSITWRGDTRYYACTAAGDDCRKLFMQSPDGTESVLFDPQRSSPDQPILESFSLAPDGKTAAVIVSDGSEDGTCYFVDLVKDQLLADRLEPVRGTVAWMPDGTGITYVHRPWAGDPDTAKRDLDREVRLHRLGQPMQEDRTLFGPGVQPGLALSRIAFPSVVFAGELALAPVRPNAVLPELDLYVSSKESVLAGRPEWQQVLRAEDGVIGYRLRGEEMLLLTHRDAPRYQVVRRGLWDVDWAQATPVVPEPAEGVNRKMGVAGNTLYVTQHRDMVDELLFMDLDGGAQTALQPVALPVSGRVSEMGKPPPMFRQTGEANEVMFCLQSWTEGPRYFTFHPSTGVQPVALGAEPPDFSDLISEHKVATAPDGERVDLVVIRQAGVPLDCTAAARTRAYGAFGSFTLADFDPEGLQGLARRGVVLVHVVVRGDTTAQGKAGETAGRLHPETKMLDLAAATQLLVDERYIAPERHVVLGVSAGAPVAAGAARLRPDLFAGIATVGGALDAVRNEQTFYGAANAPQHGSVATPDGLARLLQTTVYGHRDDFAGHLALFAAVGKNDGRVAPWMSYKTVAAWREAGREAFLHVRDGVGHLYDCTVGYQAQIETDMAAFILMKTGHPDFQLGA